MSDAPEKLAAQLQKALADAARCASEETPQNYDLLTQDLADLGGLAKRACGTHADYRALLGKLRAGTALSADEMATVRRLIVGDAEAYVKYDEEFDRCKNEVARIVAEIRQLPVGQGAVDALMRLNVLCREAGGLLALARHYLEARERISRFETATAGGIDQDSGRALAGMIEEMVA